MSDNIIEEHDGFIRITFTEDGYKNNRNLYIVAISFIILFIILIIGVIITIIIKYTCLNNKIKNIKNIFKNNSNYKKPLKESRPLAPRHPSNPAKQRLPGFY